MKAAHTARSVSRINGASIGIRHYQSTVIQSAARARATALPIVADANDAECICAKDVSSGLVHKPAVAVDDSFVQTAREVSLPRVVISTIR